jgi:hypothetical protein
MRLALLNLDKTERIEPTPHMKGFCPVCNAGVFSKCGHIKIYHWAHLKNSTCDYYKNKETQWHIDWKNEFPEECRELKIPNANRYADVFINNWAIEFQSIIDIDDICLRHKKYPTTIWIFPFMNIKCKVVGFKTVESHDITEEFFWEKKNGYEHLLNLPYGKTNSLAEICKFIPQHVFLDIGNEYLLRVEEIDEYGRYDDTYAFEGENFSSEGYHYRDIIYKQYNKKDLINRFITKHNANKQAVLA